MDKAVARLKEREAQAQAAYQEMAAAMARREPIDDDRAAGLLQAAGKTTDDLQADIDRWKRIHELEALIAEGPAIEAAWHEHNTDMLGRIEHARQDARDAQNRANRMEGEFAAESLDHANQSRRIAEARGELNRLQGKIVGTTDDPGILPGSWHA